MFVNILALYPEATKENQEIKMLSLKGLKVNEVWISKITS